MNTPNDQQLLAEFARNRTEAAFTELVRRHVDLVYSAALRMVCDPHPAKDVTQAVFTALAQNAAQLSRHPALSGWLHRTTRNLAANVVRSEVRRRVREQEAAAMNEMLSTESDTAWDHIAPHLDVALDELPEADRDAVLLRYFEKKSAQDIAEHLGISAEAAQKRINRAVEKLRESFSKRKIAVGATGLVVLISANAVQSAPIGLVVTISAAAFAGTAVTTSTVIAATKTIAMTTLQKTLITVTVAVLAGAGIYEANQAAQLRAQVQTFQQQQTPLAEQVRKLQSELKNTTGQLASLREDNQRLNRNISELLKLRGQNTVLHRKNQELQELVDVNHPNVAGSQINLDDYPAPASFGDLGQDTPENATKTFLWAIATKNQEKLKELVMLPKGVSASESGAFWETFDFDMSSRAKGAKLTSVAELRDGEGPADFAFIEGDTIDESAATTDLGESTTFTTIGHSSVLLRRSANKWRIVIPGAKRILSPRELAEQHAEAIRQETDNQQPNQP